MDPNGKPCRVCSDFQGWTKEVSGKSASNKNSNSTNKDVNSSTKTTDDATTIHGRKSNSTSTTNIKHKEKLPCPPDYVELGNSTWTFLHSTAAYYPNQPSEIQKSSMYNLLQSVSQLYPCQPCAEHMREEIVKNPPKVGNKLEASNWLCWFHNEVNVLLGKEKFDCNRVLERWYTGPEDGSCD
ncbi:FAD-dependent thiol oxidase [Neoconidiobolus thromboides FSU 785]|nr:FAD-dependent thiol oxidase [Neoconidiobolus thromboides FSU 785]